MTGPTWTWSDSGRTLRWLAATVAGLALAPSSASGHLVSTGLGPYFDGISHMAVTPQDLLPVLALSLLAGLGGKGYSRNVLFVLPAAWLAGGLVGLATGWSAPLATTVISFLVLGGLVAADRPMSERVGLGLAIVLGLLHGQMNGVEMRLTGIGFSGLIGVISVLFVVVSLVSAVVVSLRVPWTRIAVRVAGSWIVAVGLLYLGWTFST
jgi:hydrogenase/urease accessory protein HupE